MTNLTIDNHYKLYAENYDCGICKAPRFNGLWALLVHQLIWHGYKAAETILLKELPND